MARGWLRQEVGFIKWLRQEVGFIRHREASKAYLNTVVSVVCLENCFIYLFVWILINIQLTNGRVVIMAKRQLQNVCTWSCSISFTSLHWLIAELNKTQLDSPEQKWIQSMGNEGVKLLLAYIDHWDPDRSALTCTTHLHEWMKYCIDFYASCL